MSNRLIDHWDWDESANLGTQSESFHTTVFPTIKRVFAQTLSQNIVPVQPMGGGNSGEEINKIDREVKEQNREGKIESIVSGKEYKEMKREDHPDYVKSDGPNGMLFYLDFVYNDPQSATGSGRTL